MENNDVLEYLKKGFCKEDPCRSSVLEAHFGCRGPQIRDAVRELRRLGEPICVKSNCKEQTGGYYYSEAPEDIAEMKQDLRNRITSMQNTLRLFELKYPERP